MINGTVLNVNVKSSILAPKNFLKTMSGHTHNTNNNVIRKIIMVRETVCICFTRFLKRNNAKQDMAAVKNRQNAR